MNDVELKIYGEEDKGKVWIGGQELLLNESLKVRNHSSTGFAWGYAGSGPSQLALAILMKFMPPAQAVLVYQDFKHTFVTKWKGDFSEPVKNIKEWIDSKQFGIESLLGEAKSTSKTKTKVH